MVYRDEIGRAALAAFPGASAIHPKIGCFRPRPACECITMRRRETSDSPRGHPPRRRSKSCRARATHEEDDYECGGRSKHVGWDNP